MPKEIFGDDYTFLPKNELLTFEELTRISKIYAQLGVKKIKLQEESLSYDAIFINL